MKELLSIFGAIGAIVLVEDHPFHDHMRHLLAWVAVFIALWFLIYHTDTVKEHLATGWHALTFAPVTGAKE